MNRKLLTVLVMTVGLSGSLAGPGHASAADYHPKIDPRKFTNHITNRYFPLSVGTTWTYRGTKDGHPETVHITVDKSTRTIMGVRCVVVKDVVTTNYTLDEKTIDWYAQDNAGNVWYFGEDSKDFKNGVVISTAGTWEAGVDNAQPGIVMYVSPKPGPPYRQEYRPGIALDTGQVINTHATVTVPAATYHNVVITRDTDPLNPDKLEFKKYGLGVGLIWAKRRGAGHNELISLVKVTHG